MSGNRNAIIVTYLRAQAAIIAVVSDRVISPRLTEKTILPAICLFARGGTSNPHIPPYVEPSFQFDCWGSTPVEAHEVYNALYDTLQGIQNQSVVVGGTTYNIASAIEEVQGQDIQDMEFPDSPRVITSFRIIMKI